MCTNGDANNMELRKVITRYQYGERMPHFCSQDVHSMSLEAHRLGMQPRCPFILCTDWPHFSSLSDSFILSKQAQIKLWYCLLANGWGGEGVRNVVRSYRGGPSSDTSSRQVKTIGIELLDIVEQLHPSTLLSQHQVTPGITLFRKFNLLSFSLVTGLRTITI